MITVNLWQVTYATRISGIFSQPLGLQEGDETWEEAIARSSRPSSRSKRRRSSSGGPQKQTTAGDAIIAAGYPLQIQRVVSPDGYIMYMERIPRPGNPLYAATVQEGRPEV